MRIFGWNTWSAFGKSIDVLDHLFLHLHSRRLCLPSHAWDQAPFFAEPSMLCGTPFLSLCRAYASLSLPNSTCNPSLHLTTFRLLFTSAYPSLHIVWIFISHSSFSRSIFTQVLLSHPSLHPQERMLHRSHKRPQFPVSVKRSQSPPPPAKR